MKNRKITKRKKKKTRALTDRMAKAKALVKEGYSMRKAMELAGYSKMTASKKAAEYLRRLDLEELRRGLKVGVALGSIKALKILNEKMDSAEKDGDQIKACDAVLKAGKIHLDKDQAPTHIYFNFQTIQGENVQINVEDSEKAIGEAPGSYS